VDAIRGNGRVSMRFYPAFLNVEGKKCVVVGGGTVALRKANMLLACGAKVTVVSPEFEAGFSGSGRKKTLRLIRRDYRAGDLRGATVVIAATNLERVNHKVARDAAGVKGLVNVVDDPKHSDFIVPSSFRRGDLTVAISTGGMSPALSKKLRKRLESTIGKDFGTLLSLVAAVRARMRRQGLSVRGEGWERALDLDRLLDLIQRKENRRAEALLLRNLTGGPSKPYPRERRGFK